MHRFPILTVALLPAIIRAWWESWFSLWEFVGEELQPRRLEREDNFADHGGCPNAEIAGYGGGE